ncbi:MAG: sulfatase-like hydrolase/transferase [Candidatus Hydrogenedentota bacterium]
MIFVHILTLGCSAAVMGAFAQHYLVDLGYAPTFALSLYLAVAIAAVYAAIQLAYMALLRAYKPTTAGTMYFCESLSHVCAAVLLAPLMAYDIPWPAALEEFEPLVLLAIFAAGHAFFKLASLYAAVTGAPAPRWPALVWTGAAGAAALTALVCGEQWRGGLETVRPRAEAEPRRIELADAYAEAFPLREGAVFEMPLEPVPRRCLIMAWAPRSSPEGEMVTETIHAELTFHGNRNRRVAVAPSLDSDGWARVLVENEDIPENAERVSISWNRDPLSRWQRRLPVQPVRTSLDEVWLSGPRVYRQQTGEPLPNVVLLAVDGLPAGRVSNHGWGRRTTPVMDSLAGEGHNFDRAYTPLQESLGAVATMLTGLPPLTHGYMGEHRPSYPDGLPTVQHAAQSGGYATAAFTEARNNMPELEEGPLVGGFEYVDPTWSPLPERELDDPELAQEEGEEAEDVERPDPAEYGSSRTLRRMAAWIEGHHRVPFFAFGRLSVLGDPIPEGGTNEVFYPVNGAPNPSQRYDSALRDLDGAIQNIVHALRANGILNHTYIVIASTHGQLLHQEPTEGGGVLSEPTSRIPLVIHIPGMEGERREELATSANLAATLLDLADWEHEGAGPVDLAEANSAEGGNPVADAAVSLLAPRPELLPVTVAGNPLRGALRSDRWRYVWQSEWRTFEEPFEPHEGRTIGLYDSYITQADVWRRDRHWPYPEVTAEHRTRLIETLDAQYQQGVTLRRMLEEEGE